MDHTDTITSATRHVDAVRHHTIDAALAEQIAAAEAAYQAPTAL